MGALPQAGNEKIHGSLRHLGGAAVFLASDALSFVDGHVIYVDGGVTATL